MTHTQLTPEFTATLSDVGWDGRDVRPPRLWLFALVLGWPVALIPLVRGENLRYASARVDVIAAIVLGLIVLCWLSARQQWRKQAASQDLTALRLLARAGTHLPAGTVVAQTGMLIGVRLQGQHSGLQSWSRLWLVVGTDALLVWQVDEGEPASAPSLVMRLEWRDIASLSIQAVDRNGAATPRTQTWHLHIEHLAGDAIQQLSADLVAVEPAQALETAFAQHRSAGVSKSG